MADTSTIVKELEIPPIETARLKRWQWIMVALMFIGYGGYYFCRVNLSVATPMMIDALGRQGITEAAIGTIATLGTACYAAGKFINGSIADFLGGKRMFLFGMGGAILFTLLFGIGGSIPVFTLAWMMNKLVQSTGWVGMVKMTSRWFSFATYSAAMGVISLSFLLGDFAWKLALGQMIDLKWIDWRGVFYVSAGALTVIFVINLLFIKESPKDIGEPEPAASPTNLFGEAGNTPEPNSLRGLLLPLLRNSMFWVVCILSFGFTLVREVFNTWTPEYLHRVVGMSSGDAAQAASIFPLFGAISVLLCGFLGNRVGRGGRAAIILIGLILSVPALLALGAVHFGSRTLPEVALGAAAFVLIGPYAYLAGTISLDFGGKRGSATAAGWIDGVGYIGGMLAGKGAAILSQNYGWSGVFSALAVLTALSCIPAVIYWRNERRLSAVAVVR